MPETFGDYLGGDTVGLGGGSSETVRDIPGLPGHSVYSGAFSYPEVRTGHQERVVMRRLVLLLSLLLVVVGCSSGSDSGVIAFEHVFDMATEASVWTATGEAIDNDLFCSAATGFIQGFEGEDGAIRMPGEAASLFEAGEPFMNVSVESMTCDDGSGEFTLRFFNEIDPSISDRQPVSGVTWTITGGSGYDTTFGEGDSGIPYADDDRFFFNGTGTIAKD